MIAAMANNRIIGQDNQMPWHLPADLQHFKQVTMAKLVLVSKRRKIQLLVRVAKFVTRSIPFEVVFVVHP